ncbi:MAG TPA: hypothetical protein DDW23_04435 [Planctomycetes bacterium]|nr:hypothetical protein [Planctomycetota bacterium]
MEFVWVVPRTAILGPEAFQGFRPMTAKELENQFLAPARSAGFFVERRWAETQPDFKQPIPYVAVTQGSEILALTRLKTQGEARLHGKKSIGVGGHINPCDAEENGDILQAACLRELNEELVLPKEIPPLTPLGLLNDDSTEVGSVHIGVVFRLDSTGKDVSIREASAMTGGFEDISSLEEAASQSETIFETWSSLLLRSGTLTPEASLVS